MPQEKVNEAFFWKHLADTLLVYSGLDKELFYHKIKPVKSVWDIEDLDKVRGDISNAIRNRTIFIKKNFVRIISELESNNE